MADVVIATRDRGVSDLLVLTFRDVAVWRVRAVRPEDVLTNLSVPPKPGIVVVDLNGDPADEALVAAIRRQDRKVTIVGVCPKDSRTLVKHVRLEHDISALVMLPIEPWSLLDQAFRLSRGAPIPA